MQNIQILRKVPVMFVITCFCKHSNCLDFARSVSPSLWYAVPVFWIKSICTGFHISHQKNFHIYIIFHQQCNSYLECYKKHNSFELNKNVILKTFDSNIRVYFEGHIFDLITNSGKLVQKRSSEQSFLKTLKQKVTL